MGILGCAIIFGIISLVKMLAAIFKLLSYKAICMPCQAEITKIDSVIENYDDKKGVTQYRYTVEVDCQDKRSKTVLEEITRFGIRSEKAPGTQLKVLYNPDTTDCVVTSTLLSNIVPPLISLLLCAGLVFVSIQFLL